MAKRKSGLGSWLLVGLVIFSIAQCNRSDDRPAGQSTAAARPSATQQAPTVPAVTAQPPSQRSVPNSPPAIPSPIIRYVLASSLNVRSAPTTNAGVVGSVANGEQVRIFDMDGEWARISEPGDAAKWVHGSYLATQRPAQPAPQMAIVQQPAAPTIPRNQIVQEIINRSIRGYSGNCPCPYNYTASGRRCGGNSAYSRPGGRSPICYPGDVTDAMIAAFRP